MTAATALAMEALRRELQAERDRRLAQDKAIATLQARSTATAEEQQTASLAASRSASEADTYRCRLRDSEEERHRLRQAAEHLDRSLAKATAQRTVALDQGRLLQAALRGVEGELATLRGQLTQRRTQAALPAARSTRHQEQVQKLRDLNREQAKQLREAKRQLQLTEREKTRRLAPSKEVGQLRAENERLTMLLAAAEVQGAEQSSKIKRLKKHNARLREEADTEDHGWLERAASAVGRFFTCMHRPKWTADSGPNGPPIPAQMDRRFRSIGPDSSVV